MQLSYRASWGEGGHQYYVTQLIGKQNKILRINQLDKLVKQYKEYD